jgi:hypothetical protein
MRPLSNDALTAMYSFVSRLLVLEHAWPSTVNAELVELGRFGWIGGMMIV